jgi:hypothetical protein
VLIPCGAGAYNSNATAFVVRDGKAAPAQFDFGPRDDAGRLANARWEPATGQLSQVRYQRGLGDCGTRQGWVWDGSRFRQILAATLDDCGGARDWPAQFRATPVYR